MASNYCYIHEDTVANKNCENCDKSICDEDHRNIEVKTEEISSIKLVCPECFDLLKIEQQSNRRKVIITLIVAIDVVIAGVVVFFLSM